MKFISDPDDLSYRNHIEQIAAEDAAEVLRKDREYGASWKKRGGVGAFFSMIRKVDRLNTQIPSEKHGYDIFVALDEQSDPGHENLIDTIRDLRRYLILIEAESTVRRAKLIATSEKSSPEVVVQDEHGFGHSHTTMCGISRIGGKCDCR